MLEQERFVSTGAFLGGVVYAVSIYLAALAVICVIQAVGASLDATTASNAAMNAHGDAFFAYQAQEAAFNGAARLHVVEALRQAVYAVLAFAVGAFIRAGSLAAAAGFSAMVRLQDMALRKHPGKGA